jgi:hypothetical protein
MVSIVILCLAIIPMVGMFDVGLSLATRSGNYDKARAFANETLEQAMEVPYEEVRDEFPTGSAVPGAEGGYASSEIPVPAGARLPAGATYSVTKQYVTVSQDSSTAILTETEADAGMVRIGVVVAWAGHSYAVSGVSASDVG